MVFDRHAASKVRKQRKPRKGSAAEAERLCSIFRETEAVFEVAKPSSRDMDKCACATFIGLHLGMLEVSCYGTNTRG
jgi:hypothetical protein